MGRYAARHAKIPETSLADRLLSMVFRAPITLAFILPAIYGAWTFPVAYIELTIGFGPLLVILLARPAAWLAIIPAAIAAPELGYWSGRVYVSELDLMLMVTFGVVLWRRGLPLLGGGWALGILAMVLMIYNGLVTRQGLFPYFAGGLGMWNDHLSTLNSLREFRPSAIVPAADPGRTPCGNQPRPLVLRRNDSRAGRGERDHFM